MSFLKKIGQLFAKAARIFVTEGAAVEKIAVPVAEALLPQFAPIIAEADVMFQNVVKEVVKVEAAAASAATAPTGAGKLAAVLSNIGPAMDTWIASSFPGSKGLSQASKAGLVNAVVAILNEVSGDHLPNP
jgi:hypothetical protein